MLRGITRTEIARLIEFGLVTIYNLRWPDIVFILCARAPPLLNFWGAVMLVKRMLFSHAQFLILQNLVFYKLIGNFFVPVSKISFCEFF